MGDGRPSAVASPSTSTRSFATASSGPAAPPEVNIASYADGFALSVKSEPVRLVIPHDLAGGIEDSWYSPSYGVRPHRLALRAHVEVDPSRTWRFAIGPTLAVEKWQARSRSSLEAAESVSA